MSVKLSPNEQKIIDYLKVNPGKNKTTKVADSTGINRKSFGRYAKRLAEKELITREYRMEKSVRYWLLEIAKPKPKIEWDKDRQDPDVIDVSDCHIMYDVATKRLEDKDFFKTTEFKEYKEHIVESLEFERILYFFRYARVHRPKFKGDTVEKRFNKTEKELKQFREFKRGSAGDFKLVMNEFQELLKKRKNK